MPEREHEIMRVELLGALTKDIHEKMAQIYGDRLARLEAKENNEILPGIPNENLDLDLASKIRQLLATLHDDGHWTDAKGQRELAEHAIARSRTSFGTSTPEQGTEILFSGNDKYGLVYGMEGESEHVPSEQFTREAERVYLGWYVELFNRYVIERPAEMYKIAERISQAGLPLQPWIQAWMKRHKKGF